MQVTEDLKRQFQHDIQDKYIDKLVENLENRFAESDLLGALVTIFHPSNAANTMQSSTSSFDSYGDAAVDLLATKFTTTVVKEKLQLEWMGFKHILIGKFAEVSEKEVVAALSGDSSFSFLYPTLSKLASISLTLPISTADCERGS